MCKRFLVLFCAVMFLAAANDVSAQTLNNWTMGGGTTDWGTAANWSAGVPAAGQLARIVQTSPGQAVEIAAGFAATTQQLELGSLGGVTGELIMQPGSSLLLTGANPNVTIGHASPTTFGNMWINSASLTQSGSNALFVVGGILGQGTLEINGNSALDIGSLQITHPAGHPNNSGHLQFNDGTIHATAWNMYTADSTMDIEAGVLTIDGDFTAAAAVYAGNGWLTGYGSPSNVQWTFDSGLNETTVWAAIPEPTSLVLLGLGCLGVLMPRERRQLRTS